ncbi:MAG: hypothetical protein HC869_08360 [Rhodospirillales bacterium]|nr:hypothetical protein [Rhodospirillales bacterium]
MDLYHAAVREKKKRFVHVAAPGEQCHGLSGKDVRVTNFPSKLAFNGTASLDIVYAIPGRQPFAGTGHL